MQSPPVVQNITDFFDTYAKALELHDTKGLAYLHHIPCTMLSDDASTLFNDSGKLEGFFNQGVAFYRQFGIVYAHAELWSKLHLSDKICKAKVHWKYTDANNDLVYACDYHYVLKLDKGNQWKIVLSVSVNEKERMEEWQHKSNHVQLQLTK